MKKSLLQLLALILFTLPMGCSDADDLFDLALDPPERRPIDRTRLGLNNFFVDPEFGSIQEQFLEIRDTLKIPFIRILMAWSNEVQPTPDSPPNYSFYDEIMSNVPPGVDVLIVLVHTPSWMSNPANWIDGDPRRTWVERWLEPTVARYSRFGGITGYEVWNEPDLTTVPSDIVLGLEDPVNYFDLLQRSSRVIRGLDPNRFVVIAATEAINQNFPNHLNYNKTLRDLGAENLVDIWNIHFYSKNYETVVTSNGIGDFLNGLTLPIWLTESGENGVNNQLAYVEEAWPFLRNEVPGIDRIYYYQFGETVPADITFGLRTNDPAFPVSDLYISLRDGS